MPQSHCTVGPSWWLRRTPDAEPSLVPDPTRFFRSGITPERYWDHRKVPGLYPGTSGKLFFINVPVTLYGWAVPAAPEDPRCRTELNLGHPGIEPGRHRDDPGSPWASWMRRDARKKVLKFPWLGPDPPPPVFLLRDSTGKAPGR